MLFRSGARLDRLIQRIRELIYKLMLGEKETFVAMRNMLLDKTGWLNNPNVEIITLDKSSAHPAISGALLAAAVAENAPS